MSIKIASMNFGDCDTILHNTPNGMKNIVEVLGPNGEVYWSSTKELTGIPPLSIRSNGTMLLDYLISGNMSQTGTPTPTTPMQPQECGERTGNLFDMHSYSGASAGISDIVIGKDSVTFNASSQYLAIVYEFNLGIADIYTLSLGGDSVNTRLEIRFTKNGSLVGGAIVIQPNRNTTISGSDDYDGFRVYISNANNIGTCTASNIMLNLGSTAFPYEPYGYKLDISSASTTTPIYLGEVPTTRKVKKVVFKGSENWTLVSGTHGLYTQIDDALDKGAAYIISSHYRASIDSTDGSIRIANNKREVLLFDNYASADEYKAFLAQQYANGTPVCVWYVLATPTTGIVNEPLRKIGEYTDTVSMEQAGVSIPTLNGQTVIDVETTLKPSQMYIKYK